MAIYLLCKHKKVGTLIASLVLQQVKEVGTVTTQKESNTEYKILTCISLAFAILCLVVVAVLHYRKSKLSRGCMFSNAVKIMIFISDVQYYVPIKLCKTAGSISLFKTKGKLKPENVKIKLKLYMGYLRNRLEVNVTFNSNKVNLPRFCHDKTQR